MFPRGLFPNGVFARVAQLILLAGAAFFAWAWYAHRSGAGVPGAVVLSFILLVIGLLIVPFSNPDECRPAALTPAAREAAAAAGLGAAVASYAWTRWLYLFPALICLDLACLYPVSAVLPPAPGAPRTYTSISGVPWWALAVAGAFWLILAAGGVLLARTVIMGAGRRLHLFENGLVVTRSHRCRVCRYRDIPADAVRAGVDNVPVRCVDGTALTVTVEDAVRAIRAAVAGRPDQAAG